jgi:hypothetical protein
MPNILRRSLRIGAIATMALFTHAALGADRDPRDSSAPDLLMKFLDGPLSNGIQLPETTLTKTADRNSIELPTPYRCAQFHLRRLEPPIAEGI